MGAPKGGAARIGAGERDRKTVDEEGKLRPAGEETSEGKNRERKEEAFKKRKLQSKGPPRH
jgi:hypothetical protein